MEWISVEDRLPMRSEIVGYIFNGKDIRHNVYYYHPDGRWESQNSLGFYVNEENITHWMPLPEAPKNEKN